MWYMCCMFITGKVHGRFYRLDLKKGSSLLGKLAIDTLDSLMMKKTAADSKAKGKKPGSTCCLFQGKDGGVLFRLNYSIHQHTGIACDTSS